MVELAQVQVGDLYLLSKQLVKESGGNGPIVLVFKVTKYVHVIDVTNWKTIRTYEIDAR